MVFSKILKVKIGRKDERLGRRGPSLLVNEKSRSRNNNRGSTGGHETVRLVRFCSIIKPVEAAGHEASLSEAELHPVTLTVKSKRHSGVGHVL